MSEIKVNKISPRSGTTVTLGDSGDTFTIPSGATINNQGTATNFGATGSASWVTTVKTGDFTAVAGEGYFVDTTSQEIDVALPAGTAGAVVAVADYANTFDTNNCILKQNGSDKIEGSTDDLIINTEGASITLVFVDSTKGWVVTDTGNSTDASTIPQFVTATGGTITTVCTNFKVHTFTGPGTFCVSNAGNGVGSQTVDYLVVAGGASGGTGNNAGGGGAGGYRESSGAASGCYTASPLGSGVSALPVSAQSYSVTVGAGGAQVPKSPGSDARGNQGANSVFSTITSTGGGGGATGDGSTDGTPGTDDVGQPGGSGGGSGYANYDGNPGTGGTGNTPSVSPPQGNNGGSANTGAPAYGASGGGGATAAGTAGSGSGAGPGGAGATSSINATPTARAGGGGGGTNGPISSGGAGGGGAGAPPSAEGVAGTVNTGGGGGGGGNPVSSPSANVLGGAGGSGIVIIRYKFQ